MERQVESENEEKQQRMDLQRGQALEMRERAMEWLGQTRKRTGQVKAVEKNRRKEDQEI